MKNINNTWKRIAAGALSLALVAGAMPANVGGFLTGGKGIVAHAEDYTIVNLRDLRNDVNVWLDRPTQEQTTNGNILEATDRNTYQALRMALNDAQYVYDSPDPTQANINQAYDTLYSAFSDAKRAVIATPITGEEFLALAEDHAITLDKDYRITDTLSISLAELDLNLNGHALYMGDGELGVFEATLTVEDNSETGTGLLVGNANVLFNKGTVTIDGGTIKGNITNRGSSTPGNPDVTMNIKSGVINGSIYNEYDSAKLNISGGEIGLNQEEALHNNGGAVTVTGGKFNFNPTDFVPARYKVIKDEVSNIYEVSEMMPFSAETAITDGSEINLYAEDNQSYQATVTIIGSEEFSKDEALDWLGITIEPGNDKLYVKDKDDEDIIAAISLSGDDNATVDTTDNKYKLTLTFTAVPFYYTVGNSDAHIYNNTGSGTVTIGGINININVNKRIAESVRAVLDLDGLTALKYSEGDDTVIIPKSMFATYPSGISIPAGATVTLETQYKSEFSYNDGFTQEITDLTETAGNNRAYTYSFKMPAYNVDHSFEKYTFTDNTLYDHDNDASTDDETSITARTEYDDNAVYYYGKDVTIKSANRLIFTDDNDKLIEFTENKSETDGTYTYTFKVTSDVTASLYEHKHDYTYKVEDNQLIRTCKLEEDSCEEGNDDIPIAELKLDTPFADDTSAYTYDKEAKSVSLDGTLIPGVTVTADTLSYYKADAFGDAVSNELAGAPSDAGKYLATQKVWYDIDEDNIKDDDELFDLSLNFEIKPKDINEVDFTVKESNQDADGVYILNESDPNGYASPIVSLNYGDDELVKGIKKDYVVTGTTTTTKFGKYTAAVSGVGNYTGTIEFDWRYGAADAETTELTSDMINVETVYRNGYAQAIITVGDITVGNFAEGENYYVLGETAVNAGGTYKLKVVGINSAGLSGTAEVDWVVDEVQLSGKNADVKKVTYTASTKKLEFRANMAVPEDATMTKIGVFATNNEQFKYQLNFTDTPKQTDDVFVKEYTDGLADKKTSGYTWRKSSILPGATWYAVPYVCYTDKDGNAVTAYGDLIKATVDDSGKATYKKVEIGQAKLKSASYNATTKKLEFANRMIIPDGCTMNTIGICATNNQAKAADLSINTAAVNGETYIKAYTDNLEGKTASNYIWRKTSVKAGDIWYVKPYVTYTDADGVTYIAYGALETVTAGQEAAANAELS